jgi:CRISPR type IV-associated protein Csf1
MSAALISPSQIALQAVKQRPIGAPAQTPSRCALCGLAIAIGELLLPYRPSDSFTDYSSMAARGEDNVCGWCAGVLNEQRFTQQWGNAVFTQHGVFRAHKNVELAYWLLNPPAEPFVWVRLGAKKQHLVWRAPVNYAPALIQVRFGELILSLRTDRLREATAASRRLANVGPHEVEATLATKSASKPKSAPKPKPKAKRATAFLVSARELDSPLQGSIHPNVRQGVLESTDNASHAQDLALLNSLTPGEAWALTSLLYVPEELTRPEELPV